MKFIHFGLFMFYTIISINYQANYIINDGGLFVNSKQAVSMAFYPVVHSQVPIIVRNVHLVDGFCYADVLVFFDLTLAPLSIVSC